MLKLIRFNSHPSFQKLLRSVHIDMQDMRAAHAEDLKDISMSVMRVIAAGLTGSYDAEPEALASLIDHELLPDSSYGSKDVPPVYHKTIRLSLSMYDYLSLVTARLNTEILGPLEDQDLRAKPDCSHRYRLNERQVLHLTVVYLSSLTDEQRYILVKQSEILHPFKMRGPGGETVAQAKPITDKRFLKMARMTKS